MKLHKATGISEKILGDQMDTKSGCFEIRNEVSLEISNYISVNIVQKRTLKIAFLTFSSLKWDIFMDYCLGKTKQDKGSTSSLVRHFYGTVQYPCQECTGLLLNCRKSAELLRSTVITIWLSYV